MNNRAALDCDAFDVSKDEERNQKSAAVFKGVKMKF